MEREYIAHHIRRRHLGLEHLIASTQPEKHSEDYSRQSKDSKPETLKMDDLLWEHPKHTQAEVLKFPKYPTDVFKSTRCLQDSTTKTSRACRTRGSRTAHRHRIF
jgi:hypothetical protein